MTFKQMIRNLTRNSAVFARDGETAKAAACLAMVVFIQSNGYDNIKGHVTADNELETA